MIGCSVCYNLNMDRVIKIMGQDWHHESRRDGVMLTFLPALYSSYNENYKKIFVKLNEILHQRDMGKQVSKNQFWIHKIEYLDWLALL